MSRKPNPKPTDAEQSKRFLETAKAVEADKTGKVFADALSILVPIDTKSKKRVKGK